MLKRHFFLVAAACLLGVMVIAGVLKIAFAGEEGGGGPGGPGGPGGRGGGQQVAQVMVTSRDFADRIQVLGVARGRRSVDITSSTTELITRVLFRDGQYVAAGTPLVELQAREEDASIISARAQVEQARRDLERWQSLADQGIAPRVQAEQAETAFQTAQAQLRAAEARLGDRVIRAPFAGVLGLSDVTPGTLVNPGAVIATLDDLSVIRIDFPVPERYLGVLRQGQPLTATSDAFGGEVFSGRIALIDTRVNPETRAVTARAEFANPGGRIRPGMMMRVSVQQGGRVALAVPEAAVQYQGEGAFVYRIATQEGRSTAQRIEVETGAVEGGFVEILTGLNPNDPIVASGLNRIQPGAAVRVGGGNAPPAGASAPAAKATR